MTAIRSLGSAMLLALSIVASTAASAQQATAEAQAAADRYLRAVPMRKMMEDSYLEIAKQVPADKRVQFISDMRAIVKIERLEEIARDAMLKTFTADEMNAMADFFSSRNGASAMAKYGAYMGQVMPPVMQEVQRGIEELQARNRR